ncbi:MAG: D-alanyl-D-alanine carboxypeptidase/D-alanyl-D-alanine endopeptidase [Actinomycetota bacterium]
MRRRVLAAITLAAMFAAAEPAGARVPNRTPRRRLEGSVSSSLAQPPARGALPGILIERGPAPLIAINADRPMVPASLTKLATTTAALARFGPQHRFRTRVVARAVHRGGTIRGDATLVGGGDPAFVSDAYGRRRFLPQPGDPVPVPAFATGYATVEELADAVRNAGVRRIEGDLAVDESLFDDVRTLPGWLPEYQKSGSVEVGTLSALAVDEGFADAEQKIAAADPAARAGSLLLRELLARGVVVAGGVRHARAPTGAVEIAGVESPPLSEIVGYTNRYSVNFPAELMVKALGARFGGAGTTEAGLRVLRDTLKAGRIPVEGLALSDGSGLSLLNRVAPRTIAALLRRMLADTSPAGEALRASVPVAGSPGTLLRRLRHPPAGGNLRGKTGLVRRVRAMAGWVRGQDGATIVYVLLFNDAAGARTLNGPIDLIGLALSRFPYG